MTGNVEIIMTLQCVSSLCCVNRTGLGQCRRTDLLWCPSVLTPYFTTHTHTHKHPHTRTRSFRCEGAQFQTLFLLHRYTNRLAGARGLFAIGVCALVSMCTQTHTRALAQADMCITLPAGLWACGSHSRMSVHVWLCPLYVSQETEKPAVEAPGANMSANGWALTECPSSFSLLAPPFVPTVSSLIFKGSRTCCLTVRQSKRSFCLLSYRSRDEA